MGLVTNHRALLILASLAEGDRHGYAIKKDIAERTAGDVRLGSTTLYRLLGQLLEAGHIQETAHRPAPQLDDQRRRYFRITGAGKRTLASEMRLLERVLLAVRPVLDGRNR
jgi:DNA-binding PadR family transcriptional regulator